MSQQINLFNPVFLKQKKYFSVVAMGQALVLIVLGALLFYGYALYQVRQLSAQVAEMSKRHAAEQARLTAYANEFSPQRSTQMLQDELARLEAQAAAQDKLLTTLKSGVIGNTEGYSEYMRAFARQSVHGLWITAFDIVGDGAQMSLNGGVLSPQLLPSYIQRLGREKVMKGKTFAMMQMRQPESESKRAVVRYVEFSLSSVAAEGEKK
jgi:uncharacterized coiled-coil protein SlyX